MSAKRSAQIAGTMAMALAVVVFLPRLFATQQPVAFNHKKHVDLKMPCASCHSGATGDERAGIPSSAICSLCHAREKETPESPAELLAFLEAGHEIPWVQVYRVPDYVNFSHRRHTLLGGLECATCHGDIAESTRPIARQDMQVKMARCLDCHLERKVTTDCMACHR